MGSCRTTTKQRRQRKLRAPVVEGLSPPAEGVCRRAEPSGGGRAAKHTGKFRSIRQRHSPRIQRCSLRSASEGRFAAVRERRVASARRLLADDLPRDCDRHNPPPLVPEGAWHGDTSAWTTTYEAGRLHIGAMALSCEIGAMALSCETVQSSD